MATTLPPEIIDDPTRDYGAKITAVEPGGVEFIPLDERHGSPIQLFWTWTSPNMEFATVAVGILGPLFFGLSFWHTVLAILVGTAIGSGTQGVLSTWGPRAGLPQMVISRSAFGFLGNALPAGLNALVAGIGWFAVNSISGALALHALFDALPKALCLIIVVLAELVLAFFGHNLVQAAERFAFPLLMLIFVVVSVWVLTKSHPGAVHDTSGVGGFLIMVGATFGYAVGWNPYASDYTRYLPRDTKAAPVGIWAALGLFWSCSLLEIAGAGVVTAGKSAFDPSSFTDLVPTWLGKLTLVAVVVGAVCANALNMYSGSLSFMAVGFRLPTHAARAMVAIGLGIIGTVLSFAFLNNTTDAYSNFLLVISYWIGPWLGVVFVDRFLRRGTDSRALFADSRYTNWAGPVAMAVAAVVSIYLFANQADYVGPIPKSHPALGDLTFEVGFVLAALIYGVMYVITRPTLGPREDAAVAPADAATVHQG